MGALEFPALQIMQVREDVVGVHGCGADQDVAGEIERQSLQIGQGMDVGLAGGQGVGRCRHVAEERLGLIRVGIFAGRDDLLINVGGQGPPVALGRVGFLPLEEG